MPDIPNTDASAPRAAIKYLCAALIITALGLLLFSLAFRQIHNYDIWWHLASGKEIITKHSVPKEDPFSFTRHGNTWIDLHWGFQILVYQIYRVSGHAGLLALKIIMLFIAWAALISIPQVRSHPLAAAVFFAAGMITGLNTWLVRPAVLSMAFLSITLCILERGVTRDKRLLWLLPLVQLIWVNFHSLFILGLFCVYACLAGETLRLFISGEKPIAGKIKQTHLATLGLAAVAATLASLVNPYHYHALVFPFQLFFEVTGLAGSISQATSEFTPPYYTRISALPLRSFRFLLWISAFSFIINIKGIRFRLLITYIGFAFLALSAVRNLPLFGLVAAVSAVYNFGKFHETYRQRAADRIRFIGKSGVYCAGQALAAICISGIAAMLIMGCVKAEAPFGSGIQWSRYPVGACAFIQRENVKGTGFNVFEDGGYMIWRLYPEHRVFIDGRQEVSGIKFFDTYSLMIMEPTLWNNLSRQWKLDYVLLNHTNHAYHDLVSMFYKNPEYSLVYMDSVSVLFLKRVPANGRIIKQYGISLKDAAEQLPPDIPDYKKSYIPLCFRDSEKVLERLRIGTLYYVLDLPNMAMQEYAQALEMNPSYADTYFSIGVLLEHEGKKSEAMRYMRRCLKLDPGSVNANVIMGMWLEESDKNLSEKHYRKTLSAFPHYGPVHKRLAAIYLDQGDFKKAVRQIKAARSDKYYDPPSQLDVMQARALAGMGKTGDAHAMLEKYLEKYPQDAEAAELLKNILDTGN